MTYTYDTGTFAKGRLTGITRNGQTVAYAYDRFGRLTQDGDLAYTYDKNGNRKTIGYPDAVTATYGFDFGAGDLVRPRLEAERDLKTAYQEAREWARR